MLPKGWLWLLLILPVLALASTHKYVKDDYWSKDYDRYFRKYTKHYFGPHIDWHWFKAQGIAESGLKPYARSKSGARGIMQIMKPTYKEIQKSNPHIAGIDEPRWNIAAGIFYDRQLYRRWQKKQVPPDQRLLFAFASYNAGFGTISKAYRRSAVQHPEIKNWSQLAPFSPRETRRYVQRISSLMDTE